MTKLSPDQRNALYLAEAERVGIHKSILAALYQVHNQPILEDEMTGLGISPAHQIGLSAVNHFSGQVQYAANTIRDLTNSLTAKGWRGDEFWDADQALYSRKLINEIAQGYVPAVSSNSARLESSNANELWQAYLADSTQDLQNAQTPSNLAYLDSALLALIDRIPGFYRGLSHQREALLETVRIWRRLEDRQATIASLQVTGNPSNEAILDRPLVAFTQNISRNYLGYPHQREALIRLTQLWRQLDSREDAIASLEVKTTPETDLARLDPVLITFMQRIPQFYAAQGTQRNALTEGYRLWHQLESRTAVLAALGINAEELVSTTNRTLANAAIAQFDRALIEFVRRIPTEYQESDRQREALIRIFQLWRSFTTREQAINALFEDLRRANNSSRNSPEAPPPPVPIVPPRRPDRWTVSNLQMHTPIIANGTLTWADATHGGTRMPPNQATVDAIVRIARLAQQASDRLGRRLFVTSWYRPPDINARVGGVSNSRHIVGDAIDFYCEGLTGNQIYWFLDPWWPGGLGRYARFPYLCHIDARNYRARWLN